MSQFFFRSLSLTIGAVIVLSAHGAAPSHAHSARWAPSQGILLEGVVVTMNEAHDTLRRGHVLVRDGRIVAVWDGPIQLWQAPSSHAQAAAGVLVALGTDWSPGGSPNLLTELKVAARALRDERLLGNRRRLVPSLAPSGHTGEERREAELALDRLLVEMVTVNAARAIRWDDQVGSIED